MRRLMITLERQDDLLVLLGSVGSQEDPDEQLPRLDLRVSPAYQPPFRFTGTLKKVTVQAR